MVFDCVETSMTSVIDVFEDDFVTVFEGGSKMDETKYVLEEPDDSESRA